MKNTPKKHIVIDAMGEATRSKEFKQYYKAAEARLRLAIEIYNCRIAKGLTQQKLAKLIGSTQKVISKIENGDVNIGFDLQNRIAENLEFNADNWARIYNFTPGTKIVWTIQSKESEQNYLHKEPLLITIK
jgi:transcriptional regulator with XRE-family HTH domain